MGVIVNTFFIKMRCVTQLGTPLLGLSKPSRESIAKCHRSPRLPGPGVCPSGSQILCNLGCVSWQALAANFKEHQSHRIWRLARRPMN